jgi:hypothetical protein
VLCANDHTLSGAGRWRDGQRCAESLVTVQRVYLTMPSFWLQGGANSTPSAAVGTRGGYLLSDRGPITVRTDRMALRGRRAPLRHEPAHRSAHGLQVALDGDPSADGDVDFVLGHRQAACLISADSFAMPETN